MFPILLRAKSDLLLMVNRLGPAYLPAPPPVPPLPSPWLPPRLTCFHFSKRIKWCLVSEPLYTLSCLPRTPLLPQPPPHFLLEAFHDHPRGGSITWSHVHCRIFHSFMPACIHLFTKRLLDACLCQAPGRAAGMPERTDPPCPEELTSQSGLGEGREGAGTNSASPCVNSAGLGMGHMHVGALHSSSSNNTNTHLKGENLSEPQRWHRLFQLSCSLNVYELHNHTNSCLLSPCYVLTH